MNRILHILLLLILLLQPVSGSERAAPQNLSIKCSEKLLDITWDSVPGAIGYHLYSRNELNERTRINKKLVSTHPHFAFIWQFEEGKRVRKIKGYEHNISVVAVFEEGDDSIEGPASEEVSNTYFDGYQNVLTKKNILSVLTDESGPLSLPFNLKNNRKKDFIQFMETEGVKLNSIVNDSIDPLAIGGCAPVTTILVQLLLDAGIYAYKVEGTFIKEYHAFVILKIDNTPYVLDFTADQFIPGVSPVMIPVNNCFINQGEIAAEGIPIYQIAKIYLPENVKLSDTSASLLYRNIYNLVSKL